MTGTALGAAVGLAVRRVEVPQAVGNADWECYQCGTLIEQTGTFDTTCPSCGSYDIWPYAGHPRFSA